MKIAFISDIHGNATALESVLKDINQRSVDKIFVLGDICYRGLEPQRSLDLVRSLDTQVIKGNADEWVIRGVREGEVPDSAIEIMNQERDWTYSKLDDESIQYLKDLPEELKLEFGNVKIHAFHATPDNLFNVVHPFESDETMIAKQMGVEAGIYLYAHIHKPFIRYINGKCIINIGSVGLPFDGVRKSSYALVDIDGDSFQTSIVRVGYDVENVINELLESDYPNKELLNKVLLNAKI
ncbi:metallophosphoesterase [Bacillus sp. V5-8f]|uniref:metallophosphoesterase family protein n=1 Tax=Bacillus sp. V5-8f TaxID=2053044 RepID=UPI000C78ED55|nr:metallophosphoesterase family protein [Bacillus sp. V5-8f]PLT35581.1 YfcE family phosphodiesterase [Bacillus sp. V5-8f]